MGPQQLAGPGVLREDNAALLQVAQLLAQLSKLLRVQVAPHVCQRIAAHQRCAG